MPNFRGTRRGTTTARGYGTTHARARAAAFDALPEHSACVRCGKTMWKWAVDKQGKSALHYDHNPSRTSYLGFSHRACNLRAGAQAGARAANRKAKALGISTTWQSRRW